MSGVLIRWLIFLHVLSATGFFLFHGASAAMAFRIRKETDFTRMAAMLDVSQSTFTGMGISFLVMGLTGLALSFMIRIWDRGYIWASIILMLGVTAYMAIRSEQTYKPLRRLIGLPYMKGGKTFPAEAPSSPQEVAALLRKINPAELITTGYVVPTIVLWMMVFKPF